MSHVRPKRPLLTIQISCYTNHALDQFLEHILSEGTTQIIRIGSNSKSETLEPFNLRNIAGDTEDTKVGRTVAWKMRNEVHAAGKEIVSLLRDLKRSGTAVLVKRLLEASYPSHWHELFDTVDEEGFTIVRNQRIDPLELWLSGGHNGGSKRRGRPLEQLHSSSLFEMAMEERARLHRSWVKTIRESLTAELHDAIDEFRKSTEKLRQCKRDLDLRCLEKAHVIGLTTSGLARNIDLLRRLEPKVLICEEAGEILEAHTVTAFLPSIEHAILIGDHEQLRPQVQNYDLSMENRRGRKYSLDVSLFERLIRQIDPKVNIPYDTLLVQRRMDPSISELIRRTLYPNLRDHDSVINYPPVVGMRKRLFWLDHRVSEAHGDPSQPLSTSHWNGWEIEFVTALVIHLVRQGVYKSDQIVVLTPYVRQLQKIRQVLGNIFDIVVGDRDEEELAKQDEIAPDDGALTSTMGNAIQAHTAALSQQLRIATVDNFQGEEADVVIASMVRSNQQKSCGFLKTTNRINVLLR